MMISNGYLYEERYINNNYFTERMQSAFYMRRNPRRKAKVQRIKMTNVATAHRSEV